MKRQENFVKFPINLLDSKLSSDAKLTFFYYSLVSVNQDESGEFYIIFTTKMLMESLGCHNQKVYKVFKELEDAGYVYAKKDGNTKRIYINKEKLDGNYIEVPAKIFKERAISSCAKVLYLHLYIKKEKDNLSDLAFNFTTEEIKKALNCRHQKARKILSELDSFGFINKKSYANKKEIKVIETNEKEESPVVKRFKEQYIAQENKVIKPEDEIKKAYGMYENVFLSDKEISKLKEMEINLKSLIQRISSFQKARGFKYRDHMAAVINWSLNDSRFEKSREEKYGKEYNYETDGIPLSAVMEMAETENWTVDETEKFILKYYDNLSINRPSRVMV